MALRVGIDAASGVVADASAVINLVASGSLHHIAQVLPAPIRVTKAVALELESGRSRWNTSDDLAKLSASGIVEIVDLDDAASEHFEALVVGAALETLDDGEAATMAFALSNGLHALIDERKAWRICAQRYPELEVTTTVELLLDPIVTAILGEDGAADALFLALTRGRMRVPAFYVDRVVRIVGIERAELCSSLPLHVRVRAPIS